MIAHMKAMVDHAYAHGYAVGAFDLVSLDFLEGVLKAAESARSNERVRGVRNQFTSIPGAGTDWIQP